MASADRVGAVVACRDDDQRSVRQRLELRLVVAEIPAEARRVAAPLRSEAEIDDVDVTPSMDVAERGLNEPIVDVGPSRRRVVPDVDEQFVGRFVRLHQAVQPAAEDGSIVPGANQPGY